MDTCLSLAIATNQKVNNVQISVSSSSRQRAGHEQRRGGFLGHCLHLAGFLLIFYKFHMNCSCGLWNDNIDNRLAEMANFNM